MTTNAQSDSFMDVATCAAYLSQTERWVRRQVQEKRIPYVRMGRGLRFQTSVIDEWVERNTVLPAGG